MAYPSMRKSRFFDEGSTTEVMTADSVTSIEFSFLSIRRNLSKMIVFVQTITPSFLAGIHSVCRNSDYGSVAFSHTIPQQSSRIRILLTDLSNLPCSLIQGSFVWRHYLLCREIHRVPRINSKGVPRQVPPGGNTPSQLTPFKRDATTS